MTRPIRGDGVPRATAAAAVSAVWRRDHHRPWPAAQAGTRPMPRLDLGATRNLSSVQQDLYHLARLAGAFGAFQRALPQQDGSLLAGWSYRGPDMMSAAPAEMDALSARLNHVLRLGSGWMMQCDAIRSRSPRYP